MLWRNHRCDCCRRSLLFCCLGYNSRMYNAGQAMYLLYTFYILTRRNPSESAKRSFFFFLGSDLLWVYGKGLSVEQSRATKAPGGCNLSVLGVSVRRMVTLHKHAILASKGLSLCVVYFLCACVFLQVSLRPVRCYIGAQIRLHHSSISPFLILGSHPFTPSLLLLGSVSTN